jgi:hypothetical protein
MLANSDDQSSISVIRNYTTSATESWRPKGTNYSAKE